MTETVLEHALRTRNEAMDEIREAVEVLTMWLTRPAGTPPGWADLEYLRDRLREFSEGEWPEDELALMAVFAREARENPERGRAPWPTWEELQAELGRQPPEDARPNT